MADLDTTSELLQLFGEPSRLRLLSLLADHELTVGELVAITGLTQSRVSTHLGKLKDGGLVHDRRVGSSGYYRLAEGVDSATDALWRLLSGQLSDAQLSSDRDRAAQAIAARDDRNRWADEVAGSMERHYSPGRTWEATGRALASMLRLGDVLDIGSGDGAIAELIAPRATTLTCVDVSDRVTAAAADRLARFEHVRAVCGDMHALPAPDAAFDQVLMLNILTYSDRPAAALTEAARVLRPGGSLTVVTLAAHDQLELAERYGHAIPGIAPSELSAMLVEAGLVVDGCQVTSRERQRPHFEVITASAKKPTRLK